MSTLTICRATKDQLRILFVADPQLIGDHDESLFYPLSIYDSDRCLLPNILANMNT